MIGPDIITDELEGFISNVDDQISYVCGAFQSDPNLQNGFNAVGFSQGGQFLRAYVERCNSPPVHNLITMGSQHQGVADIPECTSVNETICTFVEELLEFGAYNSIVQELEVQAQYFKDPMEIPTYLASSGFLADINNERTQKNSTYKTNLSTLNQFVMFQFTEDTVVVPKESEFFGYYADGSTSHLLKLQQMDIYTEDWIGLKTLDESERLQFLPCPGNHMQFTLDWFIANVIPFLNNTIDS